MDKFYIDYYTQEFEIEFNSEATTKRAHLELAPLPNGYELAISSRWDDNILTDLKMREVLAEHGYKGTFILILVGIISTTAKIMVISKMKRRGTTHWASACSRGVTVLAGIAFSTPC